MHPRVVPVPCLRDNYAYLVHAEGETACVVIDPSEAGPVAAALAREGLTPKAVFATHHHLDHVGGIADISAEFGPIEVVASRVDGAKIAGVTRRIDDGERLAIAGLATEAIAVPGHTMGAIAFVIGDAVFTGDTLFVGGCGRLFEGSPAELHASLTERLGSLPPATRVYCGHEYTAANARFALDVDPSCEPAARLLERALAAASRGEPTVPSTIADELAHNPFLRPLAPAHVARFGERDPVRAFAALRSAKDTFRGA
jgi:hydroxyacylglutathione hydrolase